MTKIKFNKILKSWLIALLSLFFLLNLVTGIIKFPELQHFFIFVYNYISASTLTKLHDFGGLILVGLIIIHLVVNYRWFANWFLEFKLKFRRPKNGKIYLSTIVIILALIALGAFIFRSYRYQPITLSGVEVKDYNGEKLGSVNDFRENSINGPQYIDKNSYHLEVSGLVATSSNYSYDDILKLPSYQKVVTLNCVEGWSVKVLWEGIMLRDLLKKSDIKPEAKTVIFYAADGYSTSFPLDYILNNDIIMADKMNGLILPPERGFPFQLVAEQKWGYKWIKWITKIELSSDINYKGFWESRGYNNNGDLKDSKFSK
ncbi:MAG: molybdopterin-dependent oxidoreductase [Candidatus Falkowbacteria bacterium]